MIEQNTFTIIFGVFLLLTCRDMFFGQPASNADIGKPDHLHQHDLGIGEGLVDPAPHVGLQGTPTVKIQYCHSCGYRQAFEEMAKILRVNYPEINVVGEYHQPSWLRRQLVNLLFITKFALLGMIFMDINPFNYLQMATPPIWTHMTQSKISSSLIIFFISNSIETNMMSTGAFEIFFNDYPLWSKIATGRIPSGPELLQIVHTQLNLVKTASGFQPV